MACGAVKGQGEAPVPDVPVAGASCFVGRGVVVSVSFHDARSD